MVGGRCVWVEKKCPRWEQAHGRSEGSGGVCKVSSQVRWLWSCARSVLWAASRMRWVGRCSGMAGGVQPLLAMFGEVPVCEERHCEWNVGFGWSQVAVVKCFVDDV